MKFQQVSHLPLPAARVWAAVRTPALLDYVAAPLLTFRPEEPPTFPDVWQSNTDYRVSMRLFGLVPGGRQVIGVRTLDDAAMRLEDDGGGTWFGAWNHVIEVTPAGDDGCRYSDTVSLDAGWLTPLAGGAIRLFFAHRHRRLLRWCRDPQGAQGVSS